MIRKAGMQTSVTLLAMLVIAAPMAWAADAQEAAARAVLETIKAVRTVYSKQIIEQVKKAGVKPSEKWQGDDHAVMLNAQFVKAIGAEIKGFELGLVGLQPIYKSNTPKTPAEADALKKLAANPGQPILTFADGNQLKGLAADFAVTKGCADCHNAHPDSPKKDWKQGDLMGAVIVRFNK
jgi:hypothetical protein